MTAIQMQELTKCYRGKMAVDHLNLSIEQGELFALLGVNGAGKTTTIQMLCGLISPTSGDAEMMGNSIVRNPLLVKEKINLSPQETAVAPNLTVRENLELICGIYGDSLSVSREKAKESISYFSMEEIANQKAKTLSGGWQRRLSIAMALISRPEILFLDEPTLGLDVLARRELWKTVRKIKGKITIILTTHYLEEAESLSDRIGILSRGKLAAVGTAEALKKQTASETFEDAFVKICQEEGMDL